jgi:YetA-like protein
MRRVDQQQDMWADAWLNIALDRRQFLGLSLASLIAGCGGSPGGGSTGVAAILSLRSAPAAVDVPIRTGVPFPIGAVSSLAQLRRENGDGSQEIPAQFDTLATWPGGSLKAVLVQFVGNLGAAMTYRIAYGPDVTRAPLPRNIAISQSSGSTFVDTGLIRLSINSQGVLNGLWRDRNGDGQFTDSEQPGRVRKFFSLRTRIDPRIMPRRV